MNRFSAVLLFLFLAAASIGQTDFYKNYTFTEADTLRGMLRPERTAYDVYFYALNVRVDPADHFLEGFVDIHFMAVSDFDRLQVDLYQNMELESIQFEGKLLEFERKHDAIFVEFPRQKKGTKQSFRLCYSGHPKEAKEAPWDGGFVWGKSRTDAPWVGVACQGAGASLWWPNKDHLSDEPDSMSIVVAVDKDLTVVSNGNLRSIEQTETTSIFHWFVSYPINNYNVTLNIGQYEHFSDRYISLDGDSLALDYYVQPYHKARAQRHFQQVPKVLACFERYFGKYPFWNDGLGFVETSYLGMEHQGAISYGNKFQRGYLGGFIPKHMNWDYVILHELGHEYFGNSVSCNDYAEMWLHESFTTYMEALFVECAYSYEEALVYLQEQRPYIRNKEPIIGPKGVNWEKWKGSDYYFKGSWMLHTLRHAINDDLIWWDLLRGFYERYALSNATTTDFIDYVNACTGRDYSTFFQQYLQYPSIPVFVYQLRQEGENLMLKYRWEADAAGFDMPILVGKAEPFQMIYPTRHWQQIQLTDVRLEEFRVPTALFYVNLQEE